MVDTVNIIKVQQIILCHKPVFFVTTGMCAVCQPYSLRVPQQMGWSRSLDGDVPPADSSCCTSTSASCVSNGLAHSGFTGHGSHTGPGPHVLSVTG